MTKITRLIFNFIRKFALEKNKFPTVREIADGLGYRSTSTIAYHMNILQEVGLIEREQGCVSYTVKGLKIVEDKT